MLVAPSDDQAIAHEIVRLASNENERPRIGERARETTVRRFSWEAFLKVPSTIFRVAVELRHQKTARDKPEATRIFQ